MLEKRPPSPHSPPPPPSPPTSTHTPPSQTKIKCESPVPPLSAQVTSPRPPPSPPNTGPGAEIKGKPGTPIPSGSARGTLPRPGSAAGDEVKVSAGTTATATAGGRLTFFKEGKFLLELSHRTDMGAPAGWVPVKSKTYWPPPSSATTTTTQHPLRHDTPTSQSVSDDCSSLNSSPWTGEHLRKQLTPRRSKAFVLQQVSFHWHALPFTRNIRKKIRYRRNPFVYINGPVGCWDPTEETFVSRRTVKSECNESALNEKKYKLEAQIVLLGSKLGYKVDTVTSIQALFEKPVVNAEVVDPTFVSPRKRYLRQMETDQESIHRKKLHSGANSVSHIPGENSSSSSTTHSQPNRSAINSLTPSVYSIESILNNETANRKNDSFLRTLLKPEPKPSGTQSKSSVLRDRISSDALGSTVKIERQERTDRVASDRLEQLSASQIERTDPLVDLSRHTTERYDLSRYGPMASLYGLNPYLDPRYMMLQSLQSLTPGLVPSVSSQHTEMAQAVAAATAAAAAAAAAGLSTYQLGHLHPSLTGSQYQHLLSGNLSSGYTPPTSIAAQLLRPQCQSSRSSPHAMSHSPSPKPQVPSTPASPHLSRGASPRGTSSPWQHPPAVHPLSPHRSSSSPLPSPPPQDAPLNLSKPRNHTAK